MPVTARRALLALAAILAGVVWGPWAAGAAAVLVWPWRGRRSCDQRRTFSVEVRRVLIRAAGGRCAWCDVPLHWQRRCPGGGCDRCYHADHIIAWSRGGRTVETNGQALCRACNLHKSDR